MEKWYRVELKFFNGNKRVTWLSCYPIALTTFANEFEDEIDANEATMYEFEYKGEYLAEGGKLIRKYWRAEP